MVAYNFQARFAAAVEMGEKCQTIRAEGKRRHARPGDTLQLYTGLRTKNCRLLGEAFCLRSDKVMIDLAGVLIHRCFPIDEEVFARADGFSDFEDMRRWFAATHGLPFTGRLIVWTLNSDEIGF